MTTESVLDTLGLSAAGPARERAAAMARRIAEQTGTPLVLGRDGKVVYVWPADLPPALPPQPLPLLTPVAPP